MLVRILSTYHTYELFVENRWLTPPPFTRHIYYNEEYKYTKENWMCKNYCPYKEKCDVIRAKEESEKINLGSGIAVGVTTIPSSSCHYHHFHY